MVHGATFTNLAALTFIALMLLPETIRRVQHAIATLGDIFAPSFAPKRSHMLLRETSALVLLGLAAYDFVLLVAWLRITW